MAHFWFAGRFLICRQIAILTNCEESYSKLKLLWFDCIVSVSRFDRQGPRLLWFRCNIFGFHLHLVLTAGPCPMPLFRTIFWTLPGSAPAPVHMPNLRNCLQTRSSPRRRSGAALAPLDFDSWILNSGFRILNAESRIQNSESRILNPEFRILDSEFSILNSEF